MRPNYLTEKRNALFLKEIKSLDADIIVLTETNAVISLGKPYFSASSLPLPATFEQIKYSSGENRVSIFSKFTLGRQFETCDPFTSICIELLTPLGNLIVYGTIIGVTGGKDKKFEKALAEQKKDIERIASNGNICIVGDYNISFTGYPYPSKKISEEFKGFLARQSLQLLTSEIPDIPDHIAISEAFAVGLLPSAQIKQFPKAVTDHSLVSITLAQS